MAVSEEGLHCGYVSGGCTEAAVACEAVEAIASGNDRFLMIGEGSPFVDIVLPCGGGITVAIHLLRDGDSPSVTLDRLKNRLPAGLSYSPSEIRLSSLSGDFGVGWTGGSFLTGYRPPIRVVLSGNALEIETAARVGRAVGYEVICHDGPAGELVDDRIIDEDTAIVLLFHDLEREMPLLQAAIDGNPFYIGALGSARTHEKRTQRLRQTAVSELKIAKIKAPVGLFGKTRDAQSLALSVMADIAQSRQVMRSARVLEADPFEKADAHHRARFL